jgi:hypothetical protein
VYDLRTSKDAHFSRATTGMKAVFHVVIAFLIASSASGQGRSQDSANKPKQETCTVSGMVVKLAGSAPLKSARVVLIGMEDATRAYATTTDAGGRFTFKNVHIGLVRRFIYSVTYFKLPLQEVGPICLTGPRGPVV